MFKKLFSCLGDATHQEPVADLSGQQNPLPEQAKPMMHPESNIQGQKINFEVDDFQSTNLLQMHFFQNNSPNKQQKVSVRLTPDSFAVLLRAGRRGSGVQDHDCLPLEEPALQQPGARSHRQGAA
jgi:hypothetical protein